MIFFLRFSHVSAVELDCADLVDLSKTLRAPLGALRLWGFSILSGMNERSCSSHVSNIVKVSSDAWKD